MQHLLDEFMILEYLLDKMCCAISQRLRLEVLPAIQSLPQNRSTRIQKGYDGPTSQQKYKLYSNFCK